MLEDVLMLGPLLLLAGCTLAAPVPRAQFAPVTVKRVAVPPVPVDVGGQFQWIDIDSGCYAEVTVTNQGRTPLLVEHIFSETDPVDVRWTNSQGKVVSDAGYHISIHSPFAPGTPQAATKVREIKPGNKLTILVDLQHDLPTEQQKRGTYKVVVTVQTDRGPLRAAPIEIELK